MAKFLDGKFIYGWTRVGGDGRVRVPEPALKEYRLQPDSDLVLLQGGKTEGGFSLVSVEKLKSSALGVILERYSQLEKAPAGEPVVVQGRSKIYARVHLADDGTLQLPPDALKAFRIKTGERLLVVRESEIAVALMAAGSCVEAACALSDIKEWS